MAGNRKKATQVLLEQIGLIDQYVNAGNVDRYKQFLGSLSDVQFDKYMTALRNHDTVIYVYAPNLHDHPLMGDVLNIAKKIGVELFERVELYDDVTDEWYLTPNKHLVVKIPIRRLQQYGDHKISLPEGDSKVDTITGQVIHDDRAAGITNPEILSLQAKKLPLVSKELVAIRGGNIEAWQTGMKKQAEETGSIYLSEISKDSANRTVVVTQKLLEGMHLDNNIYEA